MQPGFRCGTHVAFRTVARAWILLPVLTALVGCSATRSALPGTPGHTPADAIRIARMQRIGAALAGATAAPERVDLGLSSRDALGAWSWPDGRIRVSRALIDLLDDEALAAALAHEVGHLLDGGHVAGATTALAGAASSGRHDGSGIELRADAIACSLLRARGMSVEALPRMLRTVASGLPPGAEGPDPAALRQRAAIAESYCVAIR